MSCCGLMLWVLIRVGATLDVLRTPGSSFPSRLGKQGPQPRSWVACSLPSPRHIWPPPQAEGLKSHTKRAEPVKLILREEKGEPWGN